MGWLGLLPELGAKLLIEWFRSLALVAELLMLLFPFPFPLPFVVGPLDTAPLDVPLVELTLANGD